MSFRYNLVIVPVDGPPIAHAYATRQGLVDQMRLSMQQYRGCWLYPFLGSPIRGRLKSVSFELCCEDAMVPHEKNPDGSSPQAIMRGDTIASTQMPNVVTIGGRIWGEPMGLVDNLDNPETAPYRRVLVNSGPVDVRPPPGV